MKIYNRGNVALLILIFTTFCLNAQHDPSFKAMTYNIRYDSKTDRPNWQQRKNQVINLILFHDAEILGVQEALHHQLQDMQDKMPEYSWVGKGRDDGKTEGEFSAIFYKPSVFGLLETNTFWLSKTPDRPSKDWDAALPRVCTWAKFVYRPTNAIFYVFNTHFDHLGVEARKNSAQLIINEISKIARDQPVLLMGDFNFPPGSAPYKLIESQKNIFDAQNISLSGHYGPQGTFNNFKFHDPVGEKIDHIFVNEKLKVYRHGVLTDSYSRHYPSDHFPVLAEIAFQPTLNSSSKWANEFKDFEQQDYQSGMTLFTGSSSIRLWPNLHKTFKNKNILNRGFGGSEIRDLIVNSERVIFRYAPRRIVIYSGDNDIWKGKSADILVQDFKELFQIIRSRLPETEIIFISIKPSPSRMSKLKEIARANALIQDFMRSEIKALYVDIYNPMLDSSGKPREELFVDDKLHLNNKGYSLWNKILEPYLKD